MSWGEVKKALNSDIFTPLNELLYAMDYKMYGAESPVFSEKDRYHEALLTWYAANDPEIYKESIIYANETKQLGKFLMKRNALKSYTKLMGYDTILSLKTSEDTELLDQIYSSSGILHFLVVDGFISVDDLTPAQIKSQYFDTNRTDCDISYPMIIYNNYADEFAMNVDAAKNLNSKNAFWKPSGKYFSDQNWLHKLFDNQSSIGDIKTASNSSGGMKAIANSSTAMPTTTINGKPFELVTKNGSVSLPEGSIVLKVDVSATAQTSINNTDKSAYFETSSSIVSTSAAASYYYTGNPKTSTNSAYGFVETSNYPFYYKIGAEWYGNATHTTNGNGSITVHYV